MLSVSVDSELNAVEGRIADERESSEADMSGKNSAVELQKHFRSNSICLCLIF